MRIKLVLLLCCISSLYANTTFSQQPKLSVDYSRQTVVSVLEDLKAKTGYSFIYHADLIPQDMTVSLKLDEVSLESLLDAILVEAGFEYTIEGRIVAVNKGRNVQQPGRPITITGLVRDSNGGGPIIGATIVIKGTQMGTATDANGRFALRIANPSNAVLVFSYVGKETVEVAYTGQESITVMMKESATEIEDVVVTGYANISRESYTGSATTISGSDLRKADRGNLINALSQWDPSFKIATNNLTGSNPNAMQEFYIRGRTGVPGVKELDAANPVNPEEISQFALQGNPSAPIFILDGFEVSQTKIYDLDINRIQSVNILKDAAATAVYGSRAGNGVVVVETIPPLPGDIRVTYSGRLAATFPDLTSYDLLNAAEAVEAERLAGLFDGNPDVSLLMANGVLAYQYKMNLVNQGIDTKWISKPLRSSYNHQHMVSIGGGSQELRYGLDLSYNSNNGVMKGSERKTFGVALTVDYRWRGLQIKNKAEIGGMTSRESPYGSFSDYVRMKPYLSPYDEQGNYVKQFVQPIAANMNTLEENPLYEATVGNSFTSKYTEFSDNLSLIWRSADNFWTVRCNLGISFKIDDGNRFTSPFSSTYFSSASTRDPGTLGALATSEIRSTYLNSNLGVYYMRSIGDHSVNLSLSGEISEEKGTSLSAAYRGFVNNIASPGQAIGIVQKPTYRDSNARRMSGFIQGNYSYRNIYLFDISGRLDGSSLFGDDHRVAPFWSTGVGLNIHNYTFMEDVPWLSQVRLTATYGQVGKAKFAPYQAKTAYLPIYEDHYAYSMGMRLKAFGNTDLKWEKTHSWNYRAEVGLFDDVVNLRLEHYRLRTIDLVEDVSIPASSGFRAYRSNIGEVMNKGYEISLFVRLLRKGDWDINVVNHLTHNTNKLIKVGEALENYNARIDSYFDGFGTTAGSSDQSWGRTFMKYEEGSSLSAIYAMKSLGVDPARGDELFEKRDGTVTYTWSSAEQQKVGDTEPKMSGSLQVNVRWKQFELYTGFLYHWGGQAYNYTYQAIENINLTRYNGDRRILTQGWQKVGDVTQLLDIADKHRTTRPTSRFVQDDNMFQLSTISLIYNIDAQWLKRNVGLNSGRVNFNMTDLATFSSIKRERGTSYPFARSFNLSLYLQF